MKFGSNRTIALGGANVLGETRQLCYVAFDILMLGTDVLIEKPLEDRRPLLHSIVNQTPHEFEVVKCRTDITTSAALLDALMESVSKGLEGLIVKNATTPYVLADRSDKWVKIKPDYIDGLRDNMDLVLLGGYYGEGTRRAGNVSHFLLGVFEKQLTPPEIQRVMSDRRLPPPPMYTFCKVGSGYSKVRLEELRKELASKFKPYDPRNQPAHFMGSVD